MRCVAYTPDRHPDDLRRAHMFVDLGVPADDLRESMAGLLHTAQAEGLLVHVHKRHSYWELDAAKLRRLRRSGNPGAQAVHDAGRAVTAALPAGTPAEGTERRRRDSDEGGEEEGQGIEVDGGQAMEEGDMWAAAAAVNGGAVVCVRGRFQEVGQSGMISCISVI